MQIRDGRTMMGGVALVLAGAILTSMLHRYFAGDYSSAGIVRSRWWWEIAMNTQVLSLAFMWFCYIDRVGDSKGRVKQVMRLRMILSLLVIMVPTWVAIVSAHLNWFVERPTLAVVQGLTVSIISSAVAIVLLLRFLSWRTGAGHYRGAKWWAILKPRHWYSFVPSYVLIALWVMETQRGGTLHYEYAPLLLYGQGALPYLVRDVPVKHGGRPAD